MRFVAASVLLIMAIAAAPMPAHASVTFTGFSCPPRLPCDASDPSFPSTQSIIDTVNQCVIGVLRAPANSSLFESSLDSSGCLTNDASAIAAAGLSKQAPHCCIEARAQGGCDIHCNIIQQ